jgi:hypothetical protein
MSYNDDSKMKLLKEAWKKMDEGSGDITRGTGDGENITNVRKVKATGTGTDVRKPVAKPPAGVENLAEGEDELEGGAPAAPVDTGAPVGAADMGGGADMGAEMGADMGAGPVGSPWDQLIAAVDQMKIALEAIAAEEAGEAGGAEDLGAEGDLDPAAGAAGAADMGGEPPIEEVAMGYLNEAKKKLAEKKAAFGGKQAKPFGKKDEAKEEGAKAAPKGFAKKK